MNPPPASSPATPNPGAILAMMNAFEQSAALQAAVRLDLFTAIADGATTPAALAQQLHASERGVEILADFLTIYGILVKTGGSYALTPSTAVFLNPCSPASLAPAAAWWEHTTQTVTAEQIEIAVRRGGSGTSIAPPETWVLFARSMGAMARMPAKLMAERVAAPQLATVAQPKVLDIAGGHGMYGIAVAQQVPQAEATIVDAAPVLEVAQDNARQMGVATRYHTLAGNVLPGGEDEIPLGTDFHLALVTGFLHMFGPATIEKLLAKVKTALAPGGAVLIVDFVPNDDRVSPLFAAAFSLTMLAATDGGRAYTEAEFRRMLAAAGFPRAQRHDLEPTPFTALLGQI